MPGFMPGIHVLQTLAAFKTCAAFKAWVAGTSPAMTEK
jgi:hypothetical protein